MIGHAAKRRLGRFDRRQGVVHAGQQLAVAGRDRVLALLRSGNQAVPLERPVELEGAEIARQGSRCREFALAEMDEGAGAGAVADDGGVALPVAETIDAAVQAGGLRTGQHFDLALLQQVG